MKCYFCDKCGDELEHHQADEPMTLQESPVLQGKNGPLRLAVTVQIASDKAVDLCPRCQRAAIAYAVGLTVGEQAPAEATTPATSPPRKQS